MKKIVSLLASCVLLAACQPNGQGGFGFSKADIGTVVGGAAGAAVGSQMGGGTGKTVMIATGTLLGAALGRSVGQTMDQVDMQYYNNASQRALETGQPGQNFPWQSPRGVSGTVTPARYYQDSGSGQYCREYTQTINIGGRKESGHGVACRQPDGSWRIQG